MESIDIMIIDDYLLVAESIKELLKANLKPCLIKHFNSTYNAIEELCGHRYKHLFIGINKHGRIGTDFIEQLRLRFPELVIIALCDEREYNTVNSLFALGINGIISKCEGIHEIKLAIKIIAQGERYVSAGMALHFKDKRARTENVRISKRETEVMQCVANGKTIVQTAKLLQLSHHTVITHRRNIMEKLSLNSATEMASYVFKNHLKWVPHEQTGKI